MNAFNPFPKRFQASALFLILVSMLGSGCMDPDSNSASANGYVYFAGGNFAFLAATDSFQEDITPLSSVSASDALQSDPELMAPAFLQETGTRLIDGVKIEFAQSSRVRGKDAKPIMIEWILDTRTLPSIHGVELFYQLEANDTLQARGIGIHGEGPARTGWFPFVGPITALETKTPGIYQIQIPIWAFGQITRFAIGQSKDAFQPIAFQPVSRTALKTTGKNNKSTSLKTPLRLKEVFAAIQKLPTGVDAVKLPLSAESVQGLELAPGDIPLNSPWIITCDSRGLGNVALCRRDSPSELLTRTAEAANYASDFLLNVEQSFSDNGWKQLRIKHLSGEQAQQALESSNQTQTSTENSAAPHGFVLIGKNRCGRADAAACYEPLQQIIYLVGGFVASTNAPRGFALKDLITHEIFHAVQGAELPDLIGLPGDEADWIIEGSAAYYQLLSAGESIFSSNIWGEVRDWNVPLKTTFADLDKLEPYRNHVFFASITEGGRGSLASLLRAIENHTLSDIYRAMGMAIQDTQYDRFAPFAHLDDPVRDALAGAFVRATADAVARNEHDCEGDLDMLRGVNPDVPLDRNITTLPMTSHCRKLIPADDEIRTEKACLKIKIPEIPGDLEDRGIFQIQVHGKTFPAPDGETGVTLVTGPVIDIQLLDLDSKRDRTAEVKRRYEITKTDCTQPEPQNEECGAYKIGCGRQCDSVNGCWTDRSSCSLYVYSSSALRYVSVFTCDTYSGAVQCFQGGRHDDNVDAHFGSCQNVLATLRGEVLGAPHGEVRTSCLTNDCEFYSTLWDYTPVDFLPLDRYCGEYYFCDPLVLEAKSLRPTVQKAK